MSKHTKGPWMVDVMTGVIYDPDGKPIMTGGKHSQDGQEGFRNAMLIAAAPAMFRDIKATLAYWDSLGDDHWLSMEPSDPEVQIRGAFRKIICEIEGRPYR